MRRFMLHFLRSSALAVLAINLGSATAGAQVSGPGPRIAPDPIGSRTELSSPHSLKKYVLERSPRGARCTPRKIAVLTVDRGDSNFLTQAKDWKEALESRGWETRMIGMLEPRDKLAYHQDTDLGAGFPVTTPHVMGPTSMKEAVEERLSDVAPCDQVLISLHAHGNDKTQTNVFALTDVAGETHHWWKTYAQALQFEFVTDSEPYPFDDQRYFARHGALFPSMSFENLKWELSAGEVVEIVRSLRERGVEVTVLDASCDGGNTVQALSVLEDPGVCSVSLAPLFGPSGTGFRFADYVDDATTMTEFADQISNHYYSRHSDMLNALAHESLYSGLRDTHNQGRLQSIGYRSGCTDLMPARDVFYLTWETIVMTWSSTARQRPSHVVRRPERYSVPGSKKDPRDTDLDPIAGTEYIRNPYWAKDAFGRWIDEVAEKLFVEDTFDAAALVAANDYHTAIVEYRQALTDLDCALNDQWWECEAAPSVAPEADEGMTSSAYNYPLDEALRHSLSGSCICRTQPEQASALALWGIDCEEARFVAGLPGAMQVTSCSDPEADVEAYLQTRPVAHARLLDFQVALDDVVNAAILFEAQLKRLEQACGSPACDAQEL